MGKGEMTIEILEDGTIKVQTNDMSGPGHKAADDFLSMIARLAGGEVTEEKIGHAHHHQHSHSHEGEHHHH
jgi:hypothetical protein